VAALLIWLLQKEKAPYAAAQAMQAAVYQLVGFVVMIAAWVGWTVLFTLSLIPAMVDPAAFESDPGVLFWLSMLLMLVPLGVMVVWWIYGLWAALRTWQGDDFRYILIGRMLDAGQP
jgi:uncharacterized Tic20 family protein